MNKISLLCASLLLSSISYASSYNPIACDGFYVYIYNDLDINLLVTSAIIEGAEFYPNNSTSIVHGGYQKFKVLTQNTSHHPMNGEILLTTTSFPVIPVKIKFTLTNLNVICEHNDYSPANPFRMFTMRLPNRVAYSIHKEF